MTKEIKRSLGDADLSHLDDMSGDDWDCCFDAAPPGNYEGSLANVGRHLDPGRGISSLGGSFPLMGDGEGTLHAGHLEPDGFERTHGKYDEYGFVRRPRYGSDVERN